MSPSNDPRSDRLLSPLQALALGSSLLLSAACTRPDTASLEQDVRLDVSHQPPGSAPAGEPFLLGVRLSSTPPLAPGSAHVWFNAEGEWVRLPLEPLPGTDRFEAELPPQPRGRVLRYYFTVQGPLEETVRLPEAGPAAAAAGAAGPETYALRVRAPVAPWAAWLRGGGAALALLLVAGGTLAARRREGETAGRRGASLALAGLGVAVFALLALGGALAASFQATGSPLREVPPAWWIALVLWLPLLLVAWRARRRPPGAEVPARRGLALWMRALAVLGALAALVGVRDLL
jgi:hypothetical protein